MPALKRCDAGHWRNCRRWPVLRCSRRGSASTRSDGGAVRQCDVWRTGIQRGAATRSTGFTLLEVVLVLAIVGIFAAMAAPRYGRASARYRADLTAQRIVADLRWAQACAKAAGTARTVSFSTASKQYQVLGVPAPDGVAGDYTVSLSAEPYRTDLVSVSFATGPQIVFDGWGVPDGGGTVVIAAGTEQRRVTVAAGTGRTTIQ